MPLVVRRRLRPGASAPLCVAAAPASAQVVGGSRGRGIAADGDGGVERSAGVGQYDSGDREHDRTLYDWRRQRRRGSADGGQPRVDRHAAHRDAADSAACGRGC